MAAADKRGLTVKPKGKPRGKPFTGRDDPRANKLGAPKRGQSWAELIRELGDLDGPQAAERAHFLAKQFRGLSAGVTLKELCVLRVYASIIDDPQPGLLNAFMDRAEGKVVQPIDQTNHFDAVEAFDYGAALAAIAARSNPDSAAPGEGEDSLLRETLGQVDDGSEP